MSKSEGTKNAHASITLKKGQGEKKHSLVEMLEKRSSSSHLPSLFPCFVSLSISIFLISRFFFGLDPIDMTKTKPFYIDLVRFGFGKKNFETQPNPTQKFFYRVR